MDMESISVRNRVALIDSRDSPFFFATGLAALRPIDLRHDARWNYAGIGAGSQLVPDGIS